MSKAKYQAEEVNSSNNLNMQWTKELWKKSEGGQVLDPTGQKSFGAAGSENHLFNFCVREIKGFCMCFVKTTV